jgi:hypothetical protein
LGHLICLFTLIINIYGLGVGISTIKKFTSGRRWGYDPLGPELYSLVSYLFIKQDQMILTCNSAVESLMLSRFFLKSSTLQTSMLTITLPMVSPLKKVLQRNNIIMWCNCPMRSSKWWQKFYCRIMLWHRCHHPSVDRMVYVR